MQQEFLNVRRGELLRDKLRLCSREVNDNPVLRLLIEDEVFAGDYHREFCDPRMSGHKVSAESRHRTFPTRSILKISSFSLLFGAFLVVASVVLLQFGVRFFLKYRR